MKYLVLVGPCYLDTILTVPQFPQEDTKQRASSLIKRRGGNCPNSTEVLLQLLANEVPSSSSLTPRLLLVLSRKGSEDAVFAESSYGENAHVLQHCIYRDEFDSAASCYIIKSQETDSRTIVNYNEITEMSFDEFKAVADTLGQDACCYHFEGRHTEVIGQCIQYLRQQYPEVKVSLEVERPARPGLKELIPLADFVLFSKTWALHEGFDRDGGQIIESTLSQRGVREGAVMCCTWGEAGAWAIDTNAETQVHHGGSFLPEGGKVVDTVGAGDTFTAGMLYALLARPDWSTQQKLQFANELAGRKVTQDGFIGLGSSMRHWFVDRQGSAI